MTVVKRLSDRRRTRIRHQIEKALLALVDLDEPDVALRALDHGMKLFNGEDSYNSGEMRYDELNDACEAFLKETGLPTLAVAINYINHWREQEPLAKLGKAAYDSECDMTHYWRCEAWQTEDGKRRNSDPHQNDERCSCGLRNIVETADKILSETE